MKHIKVLSILGIMALMVGSADASKVLSRGFKTCKGDGGCVDRKDICPLPDRPYTPLKVDREKLKFCITKCHDSTYKSSDGDDLLTHLRKECNSPSLEQEATALATAAASDKKMSKDDKKRITDFAAAVKTMRTYTKQAQVPEVEPSKNPSIPPIPLDAPPPPQKQ